MNEIMSSPSVEIENLTIIENDADEPLISIPSVSNKRKCSCFYWLEICIGVGMLVAFLICIAAGFLILFTDSSKPATSRSIKGCNELSVSGKSCSIDNLATQVLLTTSDQLSYSGDKSKDYSFIYTALSNKTILTFSVEQFQKWNIDKISIRDTSTNQELIEDGDFENKSFDTFCLCDNSLIHRSYLKKTYTSQNEYVFKIDATFSSVMLSQSVQTIQERQYNISFWLQHDFSISNTHLIVYISSASKITVFSFFFVVFIYIF